MFFKSIMLFILLLAFQISSHPSTFWKQMVQHLNNFRRIRAVDLKISNMQKIYWDDNLEILARQKLADTNVLQIKDYSMSFWIETKEKEQMKRVEEFIHKLTSKDAHGEERVSDSVWNKPFNLVINGATIRMGCSESGSHEDSINTTIMICIFGPNAVLFNDRLYERGPVCSLCPIQTGCKDNLCDENVEPGLPPIVDILGVRMSKKSQVAVGIAAIVAVFIVISALLIQYYS